MNFKRWVGLCLFLIGLASGQVGTGELAGKVIDKSNKEPLIGANVVVYKGDQLVTGGATDINGRYRIKPIQPGKYTVKVSFIGYQAIQYDNVVIKADAITTLDFEMQAGVEISKEVQVISYKVPLIDKGNVSSQTTLQREEIMKIPGRDVSSFLSAGVVGVFTGIDQQTLSIRGARTDANYVIVDGIKVRANSVAVPKSAIEQINVITGGLPAQYGDVMGGVINITTRGASPFFSGGLEIVSSGVKIGNKLIGLDRYGFNLIEFSLTGPFLSHKLRDTSGEVSKKIPIAGFFIAGNVSSTVDPSPGIFWPWKVKDSVLDYLKNNPYSYALRGKGAWHNGSYVRLTDLEKTKFHLNSWRREAELSGKIDLFLSKDLKISIGSHLDLSKYKSTSYNYQLFNWENYPEGISYDSKNFITFTHRLPQAQSESEKGGSIVKNIYYNLQFDYTISGSRDWNSRHKDKLGSYGYIGKFKTYKTETYRFGYDSILKTFGLLLETYTDTFIDYFPGKENPELANYTKSYYELYGWKEHQDTVPAEELKNIIDFSKSGDYLRNRLNIQTYGGLFNGDVPSDILNLWRAPGYQYPYFRKNKRQQFRISALASADILSHSIQFGIEHEQVKSMAYSLNAYNLWELGRLYTNFHLQDFDRSKPQIVTYYGQIPLVKYPIKNASPGDYKYGDAQYFFDYNLRKKLGLDPDGTDIIDYDFVVTPDILDVTLFSPDELLSNGRQRVSYIGWDAYGRPYKKQPSYYDFFTSIDQYGNFKRPVPAFRPIYSAIYLQDKFVLEDLNFNVGVRIDRFDANQPVLKDKYLFFPPITAGEIRASKEKYVFSIPEFIPDNAVVYVDNNQSPSKILGFRVEDKWYDKDGNTLLDPEPLKTAKGYQPLIKDPTKTRGSDIRADAFMDYKPQIVFMPRIAFTFPISDEVLLYAHYDILSKRPTTGISFDPMDYFFIEARGDDILNNPELKPEKTVDYEIGFQQKLTFYSAIKFAVFYREMRDMIQVVAVKGVYPSSSGIYFTYGNIDFGTVKGATIMYDLRRMKNLSLRLGYTLQFAEGTGSSPEAQANFVKAGNPNLRILAPVDFDQRHTISIGLDYRFEGGDKYNGPPALKNYLEELGVNLTFNGGSGTPYSRSPEIRPVVLIQGGGESTAIKGEINGARLPWQFRTDLKIDKTLYIPIKSGQDEQKAIKLPVNVYIEVLNLFNTPNVIGVYRATGNPDDDGFILSAEGKQFIANTISPQSFTELYSVKVYDASHFAQPRRARIGISIGF